MECLGQGRVGHIKHARDLSWLTITLKRVYLFLSIRGPVNLLAGCVQFKDSVFVKDKQIGRWSIRVSQSSGYSCCVCTNLTCQDIMDWCFYVSDTFQCICLMLPDWIPHWEGWVNHRTKSVHTMALIWNVFMVVCECAIWPVLTFTGPRENMLCEKYCCRVFWEGLFWWETLIWLAWFTYTEQWWNVSCTV